MSLFVVNGLLNLSVAQDHLEPVEDLWSVYDLRALSMPEDGNAWAVSLEQKSDSSFIVHSAIANGGMGFRAMATSAERLAMIRNTTVRRYSQPIDSGRAKTIAQIFYSHISSARYPRYESRYIDNAIVYFTASKPGIAGIREGVISAQISLPVEDKVPKKFILFAFTILEYGISNKQNAQIYMSKLDSLSRLLSN